jgi:hypothetical protein
MDPSLPYNRRVLVKFRRTRAKGVHLPLCYLHKRDSVDNAVVTNTHTRAGMAIITRRAENGSRKSIPAHSRGHARLGPGDGRVQGMYLSARSIFYSIALPTTDLKPSQTLSKLSI